MKWLKRIFLFLLVLVILMVGISFFLPKTSKLERSATINAKPEVVFGIVNNLKSYDNWMSWNQMDPNWKVKMSDNPIGKGATYSWESNNSDVGKGSMTITESKPNEIVASELDFEGMGKSPCSFTLTPEGTATKIQWQMTSDMTQAPFLYGVMGKCMCALGVMDKMVGKEFDKSLVNLKKLAESPEAAAFAGSVAGKMTIEEMDYPASIAITKMGSAKTAEAIGRQLGLIYQALGTCAAANGLKITYPPIASYKTLTAPYEFWGGVVVDKKPAKTCEGITAVDLSARRVAVCHFFGPYETVYKGYAELETWMKAHGKTSDGTAIEKYMNDPTKVKPEEIQTDIIWPIK
ncbi:MAG: GyrI-like domain-containing protein [Chitinophagaceae bacterium]